MTKPLWLIWSNEHQAWWRPNHAGYTPFIEEAGRYEFDVAAKIVADANHGGPLPNKHTAGRPNAISYEAMVLAPEAFAVLQPFIVAGQAGVASEAKHQAADRKSGVVTMRLGAAGESAAENAIHWHDWQRVAALGGKQ
jgi:hypothetical protein